MTQRIQRKRNRGWTMPPNTVSVTRPGPFGNPFPVRKSTSTGRGQPADMWVVGTWEGPAFWIKASKAEAVALSAQAYRAWIEHPAQRKLLAQVQMFLHGKDLACWCPLDQPCHGNILLELARGP